MQGSSSHHRANRPLPAVYLPIWIFLLAVLACIVAWPAAARSDARDNELCRGGKARERMTASFSQRIDRPGAGLSLDDALAAERSIAGLGQAAAARYFLLTADERVRHMREHFTFLFPKKIADFYDLGVPVALSPSGIALKYRGLLWQHYLERFTTVEEAPGRDPYSIRYKVSLDLTLFCRYGQAVGELIAR